MSSELLHYTTVLLWVNIAMCDYFKHNSCYITDKMKQVSVHDP